MIDRLLPVVYNYIYVVFIYTKDGLRTQNAIAVPKKQMKRHAGQNPRPSKYAIPYPPLFFLPDKACPV